MASRQRILALVAVLCSAAGISALLVAFLLLSGGPDEAPFAGRPSAPLPTAITITAGGNASAEKASSPGVPSGAPGVPALERPPKNPPASSDAFRVVPRLHASGITYGVPPRADWWGSVSAPCFNALRQAGGSDGPTAFELISVLHPWVPEFLRQVDIDPGRDLAEIGAFGRQEGDEFTLFFAFELRRPEALPAALVRAFASATQELDGAPPTVTERAPGHLVVEGLPNRDAGEGLHIWIVPVDPTGLPTDLSSLDDWTRQSAVATHVVVFHTGPAATAEDFPLALDPAAPSPLADLERLVPNPRRRCAAGYFRGERELLAGQNFKSLEAIAIAPPRDEADLAATFMTLDSSPTLFLRLELASEPVAAELERSLRIAIRDGLGTVATVFRSGMPELAEGEVEQLIAFLERAVEIEITGRRLDISASTRNVTSAEFMQISGLPQNGETSAPLH